MARRLLKVVENLNQKISMKDALRDFLLFKKAEGKSERTIKDYEKTAPLAILDIS